MKVYTYDIKYLKGKHNVVANALSRPVRIVRQLVKPRNYLGLNLAAVTEAQREDKRGKGLAEYLEGGKLPKKLYPKIMLDQFVVEEKVLYFVKEKVEGTFICVSAKRFADAHIRKEMLDYRQYVLSCEAVSI